VPSVVPYDPTAAPRVVGMDDLGSIKVPESTSVLPGRPVRLSSAFTLLPAILIVRPNDDALPTLARLNREAIALSSAHDRAPPLRLHRTVPAVEGVAQGEERCGAPGG
jgi:hypothetical protein